MRQLDNETLDDVTAVLYKKFRTNRAERFAVFYRFDGNLAEVCAVKYTTGRYAIMLLSGSIQLLGIYDSSVSLLDLRADLAGLVVVPA
ncbi:hypothetical protein ACMYR3_06095 [Ampullimonas aquatilis]|uniref:hypothetical protein n=1 Tax=Ampullimonas aquatilis TaxID=1341549 RepID=UPI003C74FED5